VRVFARYFEERAAQKEAEVAAAAKEVEAVEVGAAATRCAKLPRQPMSGEVCGMATVDPGCPVLCAKTARN
jgi:hypothetical protein